MNPNKHNFSKIKEQIDFNKAKLGAVSDYKKQLPKPSELNVSSDKSLGTLRDDVDAVGTYLNYLMKGPPIGNRYQIKAGWCKDGKTPRMITVDNVPSGYIRIPGIPAYMLGKTNMRGLIPGVFEDIAEISPNNLLKYMKGEGDIYTECFNNFNKNTNFLNLSINSSILLLFIFIIIVRFIIHRYY